jgi:hypothetical protein
MRLIRLIIPAFFLFSTAVTAKEQVLETRLVHLRQGSQREWSDFPETPAGRSLTVRFSAESNATEYALRLRQQDVRETWKVLLNGKERGRLLLDENDTVIYLPVPAEALVKGENVLHIEATGKNPDDIRVGEIVLHDRPVTAVLAEATLDITVVDAARKERLLPSRITVVNEQGTLVTLGAKSGEHLAVRPGVVYTSTGRATFGLPAGTYTVYAGRGFEYGIDSVKVILKAGETLKKTLAIRREVPTPGWVACDTHVHTLTYSGHGDCTIAERMITLPGEGIELPIATDHNVHTDFSTFAAKLGVRQHFTPVIGNEVTTSLGHFNVWPVPPSPLSPKGERGPVVPDFKLKDWKAIFASIADRTGARVVILNHARDIHLGYRPFGPEHHNALTGENLDGWALQANAMEVMNSAAQMTDMTRLYHDWFGLLNRGTYLTPVGSSDSHDVNRYIVGQGRTYIRARDDNPGKIDVDEAVSSFLAGRVMVSLGLLAEITVNDNYGPGDLVPPHPKPSPLVPPQGGREFGSIRVRVRVLGPGWTTADKVELYANGRKLREAAIADGKTAGVKWSGEWELPRFAHDAHLVAVATGPGVRQLYWPIARPYQRTGPDFTPRLLGLSGAVWIDADGNGKRTSAYDYAQWLVKSVEPVPKLVQALAGYDEAVAIQAASLLQARGVSIMAPEIMAAAKKAGPQVERGFQAYFEAWRQCQLARSQKK